MDVVLERGIPTEKALAEAAGEWLQLHMDALRMVLQMRNGLERLSTLLICALEGSVSI